MQIAKEGGKFFRFAYRNISWRSTPKKNVECFPSVSKNPSTQNIVSAQTRNIPYMETGFKLSTTEKRGPTLSERVKFATA